MRSTKFSRSWTEVRAEEVWQQQDELALVLTETCVLYSFADHSGEINMIEFFNYIGEATFET